MKRYLLFAVLMLVAAGISAQSLYTDDGVKHFEVDFSAGLNTDGYQFDLGFAWFPLQCVGIKTRIGVASEIEEMGDWGKDELETGHSYASRFKFAPSLVLRSPRLIDWKSQDAGFYIFAEPGIILSPGAGGSRRARWCNWDFRAGIDLQIDRFVVFLGYGISDFALYSGYPANHWGSPDRDSYLTHSVFVGGACKF